MVPLQVEDTHAMAIMASVLTKSPKSQQRNDSINHSAAPSVVATPSPQVAPLPLEFLPSASAPTDSDAAGPSPMDIDNTEEFLPGQLPGHFWFTILTLMNCLLPKWRMPKMLFPLGGQVLVAAFAGVDLQVKPSQ